MQYKDTKYLLELDTICIFILELIAIDAAHPVTI